MCGSSHVGQFSNPETQVVTTFPTESLRKQKSTQTPLLVYFKFSPTSAALGQSYSSWLRAIDDMVEQ